MKQYQMRTTEFDFYTDDSHWIVRYIDYNPVREYNHINENNSDCSFYRWGGIALRSYYVEGLDNKDQYISFVSVMVKMSDAFSFVYFRYNERRSLRATAKNIKQKLQ